MATDIVKVEYEDGVMTYDPDMPMGTLRKLFAAGNSGDLTQMMEAFTTLVISWPYKGDPTNLEDWDTLKRTQFMRLNAALMASLGDQGE